MAHHGPGLIHACSEQRQCRNPDRDEDAQADREEEERQQRNQRSDDGRTSDDEGAANGMASRDRRQFQFIRLYRK